MNSVRDEIRIRSRVTSRFQVGCEVFDDVRFRVMREVRDRIRSEVYAQLMIHTLGSLK